MKRNLALVLPLFIIIIIYCTLCGCSSIDTSSWIQYSNEKNGLEFKYPNDWYISGTYNNSSNDLIRITKEKFSQKESDTQPTLIIMCSAPNDIAYVNQSIQEILDICSELNAKIKQDDNAKLGNVKAKKIEIDAAEEGRLIVYVVDEPDKSLMIRCPIANGDEFKQTNEIFTKIISSIKLNTISN